MSIRSLLLALVVFLLALTATAQPALPTTPAEELKPLDALVGTWTATATHHIADDGKPLTPTTVTFAKDLKGRYVKMDGTFVLSKDASPIGIRAYYSFDRFQKVYRVSILDDAAGLLDVYEGSLRNNAMTVTNLRTGTFFGRDRIFGSLRFLNFAADSFDVEVEGSNDEGRSWRLNNRIHFQRVR